MASEIYDNVSCDSNMNQVSAPPICKCGVNATLTTSWSPNNLGRRFYGCSEYRSDHNCKFFEWHDVETPMRYKQVIEGLLRSLDWEKAKFRKMCMMFVCVICLVVIGIFCYVRGLTN